MKQIQKFRPDLLSFSFGLTLFGFLPLTFLNCQSILKMEKIEDELHAEAQDPAQNIGLV